MIFNPVIDIRTLKVKKILVSQPYPTSEKSPYFDIQKKFGVELTFKPLIQIEGLSTTEFRKQKLSIQNFTAIIFSSRTAIDHFFKLCSDLRVTVSEDWQYFCLSETVALYLQKYIQYRKRKVHFSKIGKLEDLATVMKKHNSEKFLMPIADVHKEDLTVFAKAKVSVTTSVMYRTVSAQISAEELSDYDMLIAFTPAGIQSIFENAPEYKQGEQYIGVFGPATRAKAEECGLRLDCMAPTPEYSSMTAALTDFIYDNHHQK